MPRTKEKIKIKGTLETIGAPAPNEITLKEVFERLVQLEGKFDAQVKKGNDAGKYFWTLIGLSTVLQIATFVFVYLIYTQ